MQTHSVQFGKHVGSAGHPHSHAAQFGRRFVTPQPKSSGSKQHDALVKQTEKWVSQTFYGEMLKQMRNSPFKSKMFDGGQGGEAFHQMFDAKLADNMSRGAGKKLVDTIVSHIEAGKAYGAQTGLPARSSKPAVQTGASLLASIGGIK